MVDWLKPVSTTSVDEAFFVSFMIFYFFPPVSAKPSKNINKRKNTSFHVRSGNEPLVREFCLTQHYELKGPFPLQAFTGVFLVCLLIFSTSFRV